MENKKKIFKFQVLLFYLYGLCTILPSNLYSIGVFIVSASFTVISLLLVRKISSVNFIVLLFVIIVNLISLYYNTDQQILILLAESLIKIAPFIVLSRFSIELSEENLNFINKVADYNFIILSLYLLRSNQFEYMRFGYGMFVSVIFYILKYKEVKSPILFLKIVVGLLLILIFGSRTPFYALIFTMVFVSPKNTIKKRIKTIIIFTLLIIYLLKSGFALHILHLLQSIFGNSYILLKLERSILHGVLASSSSRDIIFVNYLNMFILKPIMGYGVHYPRLLGKDVHNIFIQVSVELGFLFFLLLCINLISQIVNLRKMRIKNDSRYFILLFLIILTWPRLLVSSNLWFRGEFWFLTLYNYRLYKSKFNKKNKLI